MSNVRQLSFSGGEISPSLHSRVDQVKYATGLKTCRNFIVQRHGGVANRPGTTFVAEASDSSKAISLIPFVFNAEQTYVLEFGDLYMRVHQNGAQLTETAQNIVSITNADPCIVEVTGHGYSNGAEVFISGVGGMTELNGRNFKVANVAANTFELQYMDGADVDSTLFGIYTSGGTIAKIYELVTPYTEDEVSELSFVQTADIITIAHYNYKPRELTRTSHTVWTLTAMVFGPALDAPTNLSSTSSGAGYDYVVTAVSYVTGEESQQSAKESATNKTSTLSWDTVDGAGYYEVYRRIGGVYGWIGRAGTNSFTDTDYNEDILDSPPEYREPFYDPLGLSGLYGGSLGLNNTITNATQADPCVITTLFTHYYQNGNPIQISGVVGMTELNGNRYRVTVLTDTTFSLQTVDGEDVDSTGYAAYVSGGTIYNTGNFPATVSLYQQRLIFANTSNNPEGTWAGKTALRKNFEISTPLQADDAVTFSLIGRQVNAIKHLLDIGKLIVFTASGEWAIGGDASGILTPTGVNPQQHTANGSGTLAPIVVSGSALYVQARGSVIRDLAFTQTEEGYRGNELTIFASHLFDNYTLVDWAYQQIPQSVVWVVRDDGILLGLTYIKEHQVFGWHRHDFDGFVENVTVVPEGPEDVLYLTIKRTVDGKTVRYIERMATRQITDIEDSIFMDSTLSYDGTHTGSTTMTLSSGSTWEYDEDLTLTASAAFFASTDIGNAIFLTGSGGTLIRCTIKAYTSSTVATVNPHKTVPVTMQGIAVTSWGKAIDTIGGLWHLEGKEISVFADGFVVANPNNDAYGVLTVVNGEVTLDKPYLVIHGGLPYTSDIETLNIDLPGVSSMADKKKGITKVTSLVEDTRGLFAGPDEDSLTEYKLRNDESYDDPVALTTGTIDINITPGWNKEGQVFIRQIDPIPASILSIVPTGFISGS